MTSSPPVSVLLIVLAVSTALSQTQKDVPASETKAVILPASQIPWKDISKLKGARGAALWSAADKGMSDAFGRFPGGFVEGNDPKPVHVHENAFKIVVFEGTMTITLEGTPTTELGPGSYVNIPPSMKHSVTCKPGGDCVYFITYYGPKP